MFGLFLHINSNKWRPCGRRHVGPFFVQKAWLFRPKFQKLELPRPVTAEGEAALAARLRILGPATDCTSMTRHSGIRPVMNCLKI